LLEASIRVRVFAETVRGPAPTSLDPGGGLLAFVAQKLAVAQSRVTVDCGVREVVAADRVAVPRCPSPRGVGRNRPEGPRSATTGSRTDRVGIDNAPGFGIRRYLKPPWRRL
jgi:hypothetical protein